MLRRILFDTGWFTVAVLVLFGAGLAAFIAVMEMQPDERLLRLQRDGVRAPAVITSVEIEKRNGSFQRAKLSVAYRDIAGTLQRAQIPTTDEGRLKRLVTIDDGSFEPTAAGEALAIVYNPANPAEADLPEVAAAAEPHPQATEVWVVAAVLLAAGCGLLAFSLKRARQRLALLRTGVPVPVESVTGERSRYHLQLRYTWFGDDGRSHEGRVSLTLKRAAAITGKPLRVVYDPFNPRRHLLDVFGVRANG